MASDPVRHITIDAHDPWRRTAEGLGWATGNEFCVERSAAERGLAQP
ncbi:hypothetical protein [Actinoplanes sp. NPDC049316]